MDKELEQLMQEKTGIRGFYRVRIVEKTGKRGRPKFKGDSGWKENQITNLGFNQFLVSALGSISGSKYVSHVGLGTGTVPGAAATTLDGEVGTRQAVTAATSSTSKALAMTATFAAGWHTSGSAHNIANIGLFNSVTSGTLFAGNTFASSSCASNQAVNITYNVTFT